MRLLTQQIAPGRTSNIKRIAIELSAGRFALRDVTPDTILVNHGAGGLGDALLGLCAVAGLRRENPGAPVVYGVPRSAMPFIRLFDHGVTITEHQHDSDHDIPPGALDSVRQINIGRVAEEQQPDRIRRIDRYAQNVGCQTPVTPRVADRGQLLRDVPEDARGLVLLAPWGHHPIREYHVHGWLTIERRLIALGYRTGVIGEAKHAASAAEFSGAKLCGLSADSIAGHMLSSFVLIANESGLAHLGGMLDVPTIVLCGQTDGNITHSFYTSCRVMRSDFHCSPCWGNSPMRDSCKPHCPAQQAIGVEHIIAAVDKLACRDAWSYTLLPQQRLSALRRAVRETSRLSGSMAELGVYRGGSALAMASDDRHKLLYLYDTFAGLPNDCPEGIHKRGEFASQLQDVRELLSGYNTSFRAGLFPATAVDVPYSCVHVDGDLYQTTRDAIDFFWPRMVPGGIMVFDDWEWHHTPGVTRAIRETFCAEQIECYANHQAQVRKV